MATRADTGSHRDPGLPPTGRSILSRTHEQTTDKSEKGPTVTTTTTIIPAVDRYDRLRNAVEIVASDAAVENAEQPRNSEGLRAYVYSLAEERILDGLSGHDADTVSMLVALDFLKGPARMAQRIAEWLNGGRCGTEGTDDHTWRSAT